MAERTDPETNEVWDRFHSYINLTSDQLRNWLLTRASGEDAFVEPPDRALPQPGKQILGVLGKRKVDLTGGDVEVMRGTIGQIEDLLAVRPAVGDNDDEWRHNLLDLGHDPLRAG
jgi:Protein of unknown function (DUF3140)